MTLTACRHTHAFGPWETTKEASCAEAGNQVRKCGCGEQETQTIPATGAHTYDCQITAEPNCKDPGEKTYTCSVCAHSYTELYEFPVYTPTQVYSNHTQSVGTITAYDRQGRALSLGTCFVYQANGQILTNYHVIAGAYSIKIKLDNNEYTVNRVLSYSRWVDLALLQIPATDLIPVTICEREHSVGETVYAYGNPQGLEATFSNGIITSNRKRNDISYVQHNAAISNGNSGGPLFNKHGEVIGINTWTVQDAQNLNFALRPSEIHRLPMGQPLSMEEFYSMESSAYVTP